MQISQAILCVILCFSNKENCTRLYSSPTLGVTVPIPLGLRCPRQRHSSFPRTAVELSHPFFDLSLALLLRGEAMLLRHLLESCCSSCFASYNRVSNPSNNHVLGRLVQWCLDSILACYLKMGADRLFSTTGQPLDHEKLLEHNFDGCAKSKFCLVICGPFSLVTSHWHTLHRLPLINSDIIVRMAALWKFRKQSVPSQSQTLRSREEWGKNEPITGWVWEKYASVAELL